MAEAHAKPIARLSPRFTTLLALAGLCGCAGVSDPAGFSIVTQDRYDFMTCPEIIGQRSMHNVRVKQLSDLIEKTDGSPGGFLVSATAYRSELVQARALMQAAERAARMHNCDAPKMP